MGQREIVVNAVDEFRSLERTIAKKWERFQTSGILSENLNPIIQSSWERCKQTIDPFKNEADMVCTENSLKEKKEKYEFLLNIAKPHMEELSQQFNDRNIFVVLSDNRGVIIEGKANKQMWLKGEKYRFIPGSNWHELGTGTNAIGTALVEEKPVQIFSSEHYCQGWHDWMCTAAPIRDPMTNQIIAILNMTSRSELAHAHNLHFVINQALKIEKTLGLRLLEDQLLSLPKLFDSYQDPLVIFDKKGTVTKCNSAACYLLNIKEGSSIYNFPEIRDLESLETFQIKGFQQADSVWNIKVQPYRLGNHLLGNIAIFQKQSTKFVQMKLSNPKKSLNDIVTASPNMVQVIEKAKKAAYSDQNLMIFGETGTGKEVLVQSIHNFGLRKEHPFVAVNCGALPRDLIASELFGYEGGAFTGAKSGGKKGKFLLADQGTIFLDEIADLPQDMQVYLLRVLEEREVLPIGAKKPIPINVRVICATHKNLKKEVKKGNFREDLYYRLNVISISLPPLRERKKDISLLVESFLTENGKKLFEISDQAMDLLKKYDWPGNIRQLKNCMEQSKFNASSRQILPEHLPKEVLASCKKSVKESFPQKRVNFGKKELVLALEKTNGNVTQAAKLLNVSRMTIYRKKKEFQLK